MAEIIEVPGLPKTLQPNVPEWPSAQVQRGAQGRVQGTVTELWLRPDKSAPPRPQGSVAAVARLGLRGDCHADALSPRQVLLVGDAVYRRLGLPPATLRETFRLGCDPSAWPSGSTVALGPDVLLRVMFRCEPCAKLNAHRPGLLRAVREDRGILARVLRGGLIRPGDRVLVNAPALPSWADDWQTRLCEVAHRVPAGRVVEFRQLARLIGVPTAFCRVFPRVLMTAGVRRAVSTSDAANLPRWSGEALFDEECHLRELTGAQDLQELSHEAAEVSAAL